jgi:hypothetical protein
VRLGGRSQARGKVGGAAPRPASAVRATLSTSRRKLLRLLVENFRRDLAVEAIEVHRVDSDLKPNALGVQFLRGLLARQTPSCPTRPR